MNFHEELRSLGFDQFRRANAAGNSHLRREKICIVHIGRVRREERGPTTRKMREGAGQLIKDQPFRKLQTLRFL